MNEELMILEERLATELSQLQFNSPVEYVYNPIEHAKYAKKTAMMSWEIDKCKGYPH